MASQLFANETARSAAQSRGPSDGHMDIRTDFDAALTDAAAV